ncbi:WD40-repeat-containing domain protein [Lentinula raphanica]|nr:WD40-repeat-containing domain protein [Lentinula raphanica]
MSFVGSSYGRIFPNNSSKEKRRQEAARQEEERYRFRKPTMDQDGFVVEETINYPSSRMRKIPPSYTPTRISEPIVIEDDSGSDDIEISDTPLHLQKKPKFTHVNGVEVTSSSFRLPSTSQRPRPIGALHNHHARPKASGSIPAATSGKNVIRECDVLDVLDLNSTDDETDSRRERQTNAEREQREEEEEEEMYEQAAPSLDDPARWKAFVPKSMEEEETLLPDFASLQINDRPRFLSKHNDIQYFTGRPQAIEVPIRSTKLHTLHLTTEFLRRSKAMAKRPFDHFRYQDQSSWLHRMRSPAPSTFKTSAGGMFRIVQHQNCTFVASSVVGGHPDEAGEEENAYNHSGTLVAWEGLQHVVMQGHYRSRSPFPKHYTVNDVAIYPSTQIGDDVYEPILLSTGNDYRVKLWQMSQETPADDPNASKEERYIQLPSLSRRGYKQTPGLQPIDIAVKPGGGMFAVSVILHSERSGNDDLRSWDTAELLLTPQEGDRAGPIKWGCGLTDSILFASSECCEDISGTGYHKAFDVRQRAESFQFDLNEEGDALTVDAFGEKVALVTVKRNDDDMIEDDDSTNVLRTLRIYDVRRKDGRRQAEVAHQVKLESSEVKCVSFSPDGIYLAVGNLDGRILMYDARFMNEVIYDFKHEGPSLVSPGQESYGITHMEWRILHQNRLALVTGGPDGCVRLWQPDWAPRITQQGRVIARVNADVGYFTIGDRFQGEHELVVGDGDGAIYFYDGIGNI